MVSSRIEQKIEDIYAFVESCKPQALSQSKVVVPKNDLYDLLDDLRRDVPEEITRYQKMLSQRDAILEDAEAKADAIKLDAQEQYKAMVEEHAIMQEAYQQRHRRSLIRQDVRPKKLAMELFIIRQIC